MHKTQTENRKDEIATLYEDIMLELCKALEDDKHNEDISGGDTSKIVDNVNHFEENQHSAECYRKWNRNSGKVTTNIGSNDDDVVLLELDGNVALFEPDNNSDESKKGKWY